MKFSKKAIKNNDERSFQVKTEEAIQKSKKKETAGTVVLGSLLFVFAMTMTIINNSEKGVDHKEVMAPPNMTIVTENTTTSVLVTTKAATQVTTTVVTTTEVTTTEVPATEPNVEPVHEAPVEAQPVYVEEVQVVVPTPEPIQEPVVEEPVIDNNETPTVASQEYYSDDGDYGWSHVSVRYGTPSLDADRERYHTANEYVSEEERIYLINIVASEYGSDWVSVSEKAKVVAVVMNRVNDCYNGKSTIYGVLTDYGQFDGYSAQSWFYRSTTPTCIDAVDYYFAHKDESQYQGIKYISGHGSYNSFY